MPTKLGQNFLTNEDIAKRIIESANIKADNVLEIGSGEGILTRLLAQKARRFLSVEIDKTLVYYLKKALKDQGNTAIVEGDILRINLPKLLEENNFKKYKVVANLPYYITSKIIRLLLETKYPPAEMILMVQKEVGERICAPSGKESILSISVKFYADPDILFFVPRENFDPIPEVDSAVIRIKRKEKIPDVDTKKFFSLVRAGFSSKRKMLVNNLTTGFKLPKNTVSEILKKAGLEPTQRAQELEVEDWTRLLKVIDIKPACPTSL